MHVLEAKEYKSASAFREAKQRNLRIISILVDLEVANPPRLPAMIAHLKALDFSVLSLKFEFMGAKKVKIEEKMEDVLRDAWETAQLHYLFLHLGYFYSLLSKKINFARIAANINIETGPGQGFRLDREIIQTMLEDIYNKPQDPTLMEYLTLLNSVRGIVGAVREALDHEQFREAFKTVFPEVDRERTFLHFEGALRFIRNVLSHNIRDKMILYEEDFEDLRDRWWRKELEKRGIEFQPIEFHYDYSSPSSPIYIPEYTTKVEIRIVWDKIMPGETSYFEVVDVFQNLMFAEFCYNALTYLKQKHEEKGD